MFPLNEKRHRMGTRKGENFKVDHVWKIKEIANNLHANIAEWKFEAEELNLPLVARKQWMLVHSE